MTKICRSMELNIFSDVLFLTENKMAVIYQHINVLNFLNNSEP